MNFKQCLQIARRVHGSRGQLKAVPVEKESVSPKWKNAKPFGKMPGPNGMPLIGNMWRFLPVIGEFSGTEFYSLQKQLYLKYGNLVRFDKIPGRVPYVFIMDPTLIEQVHRKEGPWPERHAFPSLDYYKAVTRKEECKGMGSAAVSQGEEWKQYRSKVNPYLMKPREFGIYLDSIDKVTLDFIERTVHLRDKNNNVPGDFLREMYKWALESVCAVTLGERLGCVDLSIGENSRAHKLIQVTHTIFDCFEILDAKFPLWRFVSTPTWRRFVKSMDDFRQLTMNLVDGSIEKRDSGPENLDKENSIVHKIVSKYDREVAASLIIDMIIGGIVTPSYALGSLMYFLSRNPDKQEKLFLEIKRFLPNLKNNKITNEMLQEMKYLKASMKESARLRPTTTINVRSAHTDDYVLGGYRIPKGTFLVLCHMLLSNSEQQFPKPDKFIPERWLSESSLEVSTAKDAHPFASKPFGFGPRACLGKRFAELSMEVFITRFLRQFSLEFDEELRYRSEVFQVFDNDLKLKLTDRKS